MSDLPLNCFLHLPRTGGTTFTHTLQKALGQKRVYAISASNSLEKFLAMTEEEQSGYVFICGHIPYGIHNHLKRPVNYFTVLRDPVERILSDYAYIRAKQDHHLYSAVKNMSLRQYLVSGVNPVGVANCQVVRLQNIEFSKDKWFYIRPFISDEIMFDIAKTRIFEELYMIGFTENLSQFMSVVSSYLGVKLDIKARLNASTKRPKKESLDPKDLELIREMNQLDIKLYDLTQKAG